LIALFKNNGYNIKVYQTKLRLFPNPSTDYVNVLLESGEYQTRRLTIYGLSGTILTTVEFYGSQTTIDIFKSSFRHIHCGNRGRANAEVETDYSVTEGRNN